jgi:hypothetical protein
MIVLAALPSLPAHASVRAWRAEGTVTSVFGTTSLLPLPVEAGDAFALTFSFDTEAVDEFVDPTTGSYAILGMSVTIDGTTLPVFDGQDGGGGIQIAMDPANPNRWGVSGCLGACESAAMDEFRFNMSFPPGTIASDALTDPPDPALATSFQFGQFSNDFPAPEEAFVDVELISLPEPAAALSLLAGAAVLAAARAAQARRR